MADDEKTGRGIIAGVLAASAIIGGIIINEVVDEEDKRKTLAKIDCESGAECMMLWRVPDEQCQALMECDGCDKSVIRLQGGECDGDDNYQEPSTGRELVRVLHCMQREGSIIAWHAWHPSDTYVNGVQVRNPDCAVNVVISKEKVGLIAETIGSDSSILRSARLSYAPEWAIKEGRYAHGFSGKKRGRVAQ